MPDDRTIRKDCAPVKITESMVRRFCEANSVALHGSGCDCDGEYHEGIRAGLEAALNGKGRLCGPRYCECDEPKPDAKYHRRCKAHNGSPYNSGICYGFIPGVTEYFDMYGRSKTFGRKRTKRSIPRDGAR